MTNNCIPVIPIMNMEGVTKSSAIILLNKNRHRIYQYAVPFPSSPSLSFRKVETSVPFFIESLI